MYPTSHTHALEMLKGRKRTKVGHNTYLVNRGDFGLVITLHGNDIARVTPSNELTVTMSGYPTATTRKRIHSILSSFGYAFKYAICQRNFRQMLWNKAANTYQEIGSRDAVVFQYGELQMVIGR